MVSEGRELALVELPIAGLMSDERAEIVAAKAKRLVEAMRDCGCTLNNAYMQHSLLALVVIPELRISDRGPHRCEDVQSHRGHRGVCAVVRLFPLKQNAVTRAQT